jgi:N12 class adenine-specific DNA methylase
VTTKPKDDKIEVGDNLLVKEYPVGSSVYNKRKGHEWKVVGHEGNKIVLRPPDNNADWEFKITQNEIETRFIKTKSMKEGEKDVNVDRKSETGVEGSKPEVVQSTTKGEEVRELPKDTTGESGASVQPSIDGTKDKSPQRPKGDVSTRDVVSDNADSERTLDSRAAELSNTRAGDYRIKPNDILFEGGKVTRYKNNIEAIKLVKKLELEGRRATPEEQRVLLKYVGWGGLKEVFSSVYDYNTRTYISDKPEWKDRYTELKELLTREEYDRASDSMQNAHYTRPEVINLMYDISKHLGFKGGKLLEPSSGIGHFVGLLPNDIFKKSSFFAIEKDHITGLIAKHLYPDTKVRISGFEDVELPDNYFDMAISNVPFGKITIYDRKYLYYAKDRIHNYFFVKSLDKVKEGGLVIFITSTGTMDKSPIELRQHISDRADLVAAFRLPSDIFKENAGTEVTTDLIILRKRFKGEFQKGDSFLNNAKVDFKFENGEIATVNEYFVKNPENVLGKYVEDKLQQKRIGVESTGDTLQLLHQKIKELPQNIFDAQKSKAKEPEISEQTKGSKKKNNSYIVKNGKVYQNQDGMEVEIKESSKSKKELRKIEQIKDLTNLKETVNELLVLQSSTKGDVDLSSLQKKLNDQYESIVKKHGTIDKIASVISDDPEVYLLNSLEVITRDPETGENIYNKGDIFTKRVVSPYIRATKAENSKEALAITLYEDGIVDLQRIGALVGKSELEVIADLKGEIYNNPVAGWEVASEYLSGNVKEKLLQAIESAKIDPIYQENIKALEDAQPERKPFNKIKVTLGSSWIDLETMNDLLNKVLSTRDVNLSYSETSGKWKVDRFGYNPSVSIKNLITGSLSAEDLITKALNGDKIEVFDKDRDGKKVLNVKLSTEAKAKAKKLAQDFLDFINQNTEIQAKLEDQFNEKLNVYKKRKFSTTVKPYIGMSNVVKMRPHQVEAVERIVYGNNTLLAHDVGFGKTYIMLTAAMELKRLGIAKKPLIIMPNNKLTDFQNDLAILYPQAKVLAATSDDFKKENIKNLFAKIATNDWDVIFMRRSSFLKIPVSDDLTKAHIDSQLAELRIVLTEAKQSGEKKFTTSQIQNRITNLEAKLKKLNDSPTYDVVSLEQMGIDYLFVDESHHFKNLAFPTSKSGVKGINSTGGAEAENFYIKTKYITSLHGGKKGLVFATGTPVSNALNELYTTFKYLRPDILESTGTKSFDGWISSFGSVEYKPEVKTGGKIEMVERFRDFHNLEQLFTMFNEFADLKYNAEEIGLKLPKLKDGKHTPVETHAPQEYHDYIQNVILKRIDNMPKGMAAKQKGSDNFLALSTDARLATMDMRLVDPNAKFNENGKVGKTVKNVLDVYNRTKDYRGTQLVFIKSGSSKIFDVNDDVFRRLVKGGIPKEEIAFASKYDTEEKIQKLFSDMNIGKVRVLIGTYQKMSTGLNVQERLAAIHEVDVDYRPSDVIQAEGRMIRQGNKHVEWGKDVEIFRYVTEGVDSYDAVMWQILETKIKSINKIMKGEKIDSIEAELDESDNAEKSMALYKAKALGDDRIPRQIELKDDLPMLEAERNTYYANNNSYKKIIRESPSKISSYEREIKMVESDTEAFKSHDSKDFKITINGKDFIQKEGEKYKKDEVTPKDLAKKELIKAVDKAYMSKTGGIVARYKNFNIYIKNEDATLRISGRTDSYGYLFKISDSDSSTVIFNAIEKNIKFALENSMRWFNEDLNKTKSDLETAKEKVTDKPFPKEQEYLDMKEELDLLTSELEDGIPLAESKTKYKKEPPKTTEVEGKTLGDVEQSLRESVEQKEKSNERGAIVTKRPPDTIMETLTKDSLTDDQKDQIVAEEFKRSMKYGKTYKDRILEGIDYVKKNVFRGAYPELKRGSEHADLRAWLLRHESAKARASTRTLMNIHGLTAGMSSEQYLNYAMKVVFDDLLETAKEGLALPFQLEGEEQVTRLLGRIDNAIKNDPLIQEAVKNRKALWQALVTEFIEAHKEVGIDMSQKFSRENYYRHEIIKFAIEKKTIDDVASNVTIRKDRSYLKQRKGSTENIISQVVEADASVMTQMFYDIETAKLIKHIADKSGYNIKDSLIKDAKKINKRNLEKVYQEESKGEVDERGNRNSDTEKAMKKINQRIAIGFEGLKGLAQNDNLWAGDNGEYSNVVSNLSHEIVVIEKDNTFRYLSKLARTEHDGNIQAKTILKNVAERTSFEKEILGTAYAEWDDLIPDGYTKWQPEKGTVFFTAYGVADSLAQQMLEDLVKEFGITGMDLHKQIVVGGRKAEIVIPTEVAKTLDNLTPKIKKSPYRKVIQAWKVNQLLGPRRIFRYNIRNTSGDMDSTVGSLTGLLLPQNFHHIKNSINYLFKAMVQNKSMHPELNRWFEQGGMSSFFNTHELGDISQLKMFLRQTNNRDLNFIRQYFKTARLATDFRESIMRFAAFMYIKEQHAKGNMIVGGANYKEALAIKDADMRAFWISNKTIGDYGDMSPFTKSISQTVAPFFRFQEQNMVRTVNLINNALRYDQHMQIVGEAVIKKSGIAKAKDVSMASIGIGLATVRRIGRLAWFLGGFSILASLWNKVMWGDDIEKKLSQQQRTRLYLYLWNDKDGNPVIFDRIGVISDFAEWFGLGTIASDIKEMQAGNRTLQEQIKHMVTMPLIKAANMVIPIEKLGLEIASGNKYYPNVFRPRTIRDRGQHIADSLGLVNEYNAVFGKPSRRYSETLIELFAYRIDSKQSAYFDVLDARRKFKEQETGEAQTRGFFDSKRSEALYNYKLALRLQDEQATVKYLEEYLKEGGTKEGYISSIQSMSPTYGLGANRQKFIDSLDPVAQHKLDLANEFYEDIISRTTFVDPDFLYSRIEMKEMENETIQKLQELRQQKVDEIIGDRGLSEAQKREIERKRTKVYQNAIEMLKDESLSLQQKEEIIKAVRKVDNLLDVEAKLRSAVMKIAKELEKLD